MWGGTTERCPSPSFQSDISCGTHECSICADIWCLLPVLTLSLPARTHQTQLNKDWKVTLINSRLWADVRLEVELMSRHMNSSSGSVISSEQCRSGHGRSKDRAEHTQRNYKTQLQRVHWVLQRVKHVMFGCSTQLAGFTSLVRCSKMFYEAL